MAGPAGDNGVVMAPLSPPPVSAAPPSATPGASVSPSLPPGVFFRDDFAGEGLDVSRWKLFERGGVVMVRDGRLDMLASGTSTTFPMIVPTQDTIPKEGPYYVELRYEFVTAGWRSSFNIDYLPPEGPDDQGLTEPFGRWAIYQVYLNYQFKTESKLHSFLPPATMAAVKVPHRFRVEFDDNSTYRVIHDDVELGTFESRRRPTRFWFGPYPNVPTKAATNWARWSIDSVESGVLVAPDGAKPLATPSPSASPTGSPDAEPGASPDAVPSPSPEPTASPAG